jgi:hypothetical protein
MNAPESENQEDIRSVAHQFWRASLLIMLGVTVSTLFATDHFNLESGIPTSIEDIEPIERGGVELQGFARRLRLRGERSVFEAQPRLAWGIYERTQLEIATPLLFREAAGSGNGDIQLSVLRKLWADQQDAWWPGAALEADVKLPTAAARRGFKNRADAGFTAILKKDLGSHSFHCNAGFDWTGDESEKEDLRRTALSVVAGHDMPLTKRLLLVSDLVWRQSDEKQTADVWSLETGLRAQLTRSLIGAVGLGVGLSRSQNTPALSVTVGFQFSLLDHQEQLHQ